MKEFKAAAKAADSPEDEILEFAIGDQEFRSKIPSTARVAMFIAALGEDATTAESVGAIFNLLRDVLLDDGYRRLRKLISDDVVDLSLLTGGGDENEDGIVDWIIGQASDRPTPASSVSSSSPASAGKKSTGRSPGKGSTLSTFPSPAS